jgi:hypothetical protein
MRVFTRIKLLQFVIDALKTYILEVFLLNVNIFICLKVLILQKPNLKKFLKHEIFIQNEFL